MGEKKRRRWPKYALAVVVVFVLLVALAPRLAAPFARGIAADAAGASIAGSVKIDGLSLRWFGSQRATGVTLRDPEGKTVADIDATVESGLARLLFGSRNLGLVKLSGKATLVADASGQTNLARALRPAGQRSSPSVPTRAPSPAGSAPKWPGDLRFRLEIDGLDLVYADPAIAEATDGALHGLALVDLSGASGVLGPGSPAKMRLTATPGRLIRAGVLDPTLDDGSVVLDIDLSGLVASDGSIDTAATTGAVSLGARSPYLTADASFHLADGALSLSKPLIVDVNGEESAKLIPAIARAFATDRFSAERVPGATLTVSQFDAPLDAGLAGAVRDAALLARLEVGGFRGQTNADGSIKPFNVSPLVVSFDAGNPGERVEVSVDASADIGGNNAGGLVASIGFDRPDPDSARPFEHLLSSSRGRVTVAETATAVLAPLGEAAGIDLERAVGNRFSADLTATPEGDGAKLVFGLDAPMLRASGAVVVGAEQIALAGDPITLTLDDAAAALGPLLAPHGVSLATEGPVSLELTGFEVRLGGLGADPPSPDAISVSGAVRAGSVLLEAPQLDEPVRVTDLTASIAMPHGEPVSAELHAGFAGGTIDLTAAMDRAAAGETPVVSASLSATSLPASLAAGFVPGDGPFSIAGEGQVDVEVRTLRIPLDAGYRPQLAQADADAEVTVRGVAVQPRNASAPINTRRLSLTFEQPVDKAPRLGISGELGYRGQPFGVEGDFSITYLKRELSRGTDAEFSATRPFGALAVSGCPPELVETFGLTMRDAGGAPLDTASLAAVLTHGPVDVSIRIAPSDDADADFTAELRSPGLRGSIAGSASPETIRIELASAALTLTPEAGEALRAAFAPDIEAALSEPARVALGLDPLEIPIRDGSIDGARTAERMAGVHLDLDADLGELVLPGEQPRRLGPIALRDGSVRLTAPLAALAGASREEVVAEIDATLSAGGDDPLAMLHSDIKSPFRAGADPGFIDSYTTFKQLDLVWIEQHFASPGDLTGPLGPRGFGGVSFRLNPGDDAPVVLHASFNSRNVKTKNRVRLRVLNDRLVLDDHAELTWTITPGYLASALFEGESPAALSEPVEANILLRSFTMSRGGGPFRPDVFDLSAKIEAPAAVVTLTDAPDTRFENIVVQLATPEKVDEKIILDISLDEIPANAPPRSVKVRGNLVDFALDDGRFDPETARVNLDAEIRAFPTAFIDAIARQDGLLLDLLGPVTKARLNARQLGRGAGTLNLDVSSDRASVTIRGDAAAGTLELTPDSNAQIIEVTRSLGARLAEGIPFAGSFERPRGERPGTITTTGLHVPIDGDLAKLAGQITIDPGVLHFQTSDLFTKILEATNQKTEGFVGRNLEPLTLTAESGVISYERYALPLGEFTIDSEGSVDLVNNRINVVTWIPLGALSDEAAGKLNTGLGSSIGVLSPDLERLTMIPFRVRGPSDNPGVEIDFDLLARSVVDQLRPDKVIEKGLNDLLGDLLRKQQKR